MKIAGVTCRESAVMMKKAGFDGVDLSMCHDQETPAKIQESQWMDKILTEAEALKAAGLEVAQCHLPYYPGHLPLPGDGSYQDFEAFMLPGYIRSMEACEAVGCPVAVLHPFFDLNSADATRDGNLRTMEKLLPYMEKHHVKLALENIYGLNYADSHVARAEEIMTLIEKAGSELVGACIDTGHANIFRLDVSEMARIYGKRLIALHVNGNAGQDEHVIPYSMSGWCEKIDYRAFSRTLREIGYTGYYNLEISSGNLPAAAAQPFLNYAGAVARGLADLAE